MKVLKVPKFPFGVWVNPVVEKTPSSASILHLRLIIVGLSTRSLGKLSLVVELYVAGLMREMLSGNLPKHVRVCPRVSFG